MQEEKPSVLVISFTKLATSTCNNLAVRALKKLLHFIFNNMKLAGETMKRSVKVEHKVLSIKSND